MPTVPSRRPAKKSAKGSSSASGFLALPQRFNKRTAGLVVAVLAIIGIYIIFRSQASSCTLYASPTGSDANAGTLSSPFASPQKLLNSLTAGQVGCLRGGKYTRDTKTTHGGTASAPITLQSYPGETATISGKFWLASGSDYITVQNITFTGIPNQTTANVPTPIINANYITLANNDISNGHTAICVGVGSLGPTYGRATHATITGNRIHDCGKLPAANHDHGIYVEDATDLTITNNTIYNNSDRGIQFYPDQAGSVIDRVEVNHNIIDGNGQGILFSGNNGVSANNINVHNNLITNAVVSHNVSSFYPSGTPVGQGNVVQSNCIYGTTAWSKPSGIDSTSGGFSLSNNIIADPLYVNRAAYDFSLQSGSPCSGIFSSTSTDTTAPITPINLTATAQSSAQINLTWAASTDNVGVTGYDVYRSTAGAAATKITTVATNSYSNGGLSASTTYSYYVIAKDAAGNTSPASNSASATTLASTVNTDTIAPTVTFTSPVNGSTLIGPSTYIKVQGTDNVKVTKMEIWVDGSLKNSNTNNTAIWYTWSTKKAASGAHTITAKAYDAAGNVGQSSIIVYK